MKKLLFTGLVLSAVLQSQTRQQSKFRALTRPTATVNVVAYEAGGRYLGAPNIRIFMELDEQKDFAAEFHEGRAIQIPYGEYRVEAQQQGFFPDIKRVAVYQPFVTIVVGLRFASELPQTGFSSSSLVSTRMYLRNRRSPVMAVSLSEG